MFWGVMGFFYIYIYISISVDICFNKVQSFSVSTDLDDEVENPEAKKPVEKVDQAKHHLLIEKEIGITRNKISNYCCYYCHYYSYYCHH